MSISLKNHDDRISALEKRSSGSIDMCMYKGTRNANNPVYNIQTQYTTSWCSRQSNGTFRLQPGSYIVKVTSSITWRGNEGQQWTFKVTCGSFSDTQMQHRDDFGVGDGGIITTFTIGSATDMSLYFSPNRGWDLYEPSYIQIWKVK